MLFNLNEAIKLRNHYFPLMKGEPFTHDTKERLVVTGMLISRPKDLTKSIEILRDAAFEDTMPFLTTSNQTAKDFEIYVLSDDGVDIFYHELDKNLTEKGIAKIYSQE